MSNKGPHDEAAPQKIWEVMDGGNAKREGAALPKTRKQVFGNDDKKADAHVMDLDKLCNVGT